MKKRKLALFVMIGIMLWHGLFLFKQELITQAQTPTPSLITNNTPSLLIADNNSHNGNGKDKNSFEDFNEVTENTTKLEGLFNLYQNEEEGKVYLEIKRQQLDQDFLWLTTLSSGIGSGFLINGMPINDFLFRFHRVQDQIEITLPNIYFRSNLRQNLPSSIASSFSDSTIYSVPIVSLNSQQDSVLIDLGQILLTGQELSSVMEILPYMLGGTYTSAPENSAFGKLKAFSQNLEIETLYRLTATEEYLNNEVLPDGYSFNLKVNYSLMSVPHNNYRPRLADERVGYFITAYQDLSDYKAKDSFVRYIQRWHLEPSDPSATLSPPKDPIVFWIDNAVPVAYRDTVAQGIKVWNKAFEKIGLQDAIVVKQMPDDADWDPADSRYNTIIWSATFQSGLLGIGPSHVNPLTGQILDADVIINADAIRYGTQEYDDLVQLSQGQNQNLMDLCGQAYQRTWGMSLSSSQPRQLTSMLEPNQQMRSPFLSELMTKQDLCYGLGSASQLQRGTLAMSLLDYVSPNSEEMETYIKQYLFDLVAHEVGHTLGLRHNFHGSTLRNTQELNDVELTRQYGSVGSVMDYSAVNLAPVGIKQGDYYPTTIGPYDEWAIEYGYKVSGIKFPQQERHFLNKIAQRAPEAELAYATDEDVFGFDDPQVNIYDLSGDILVYAPAQMDKAKLMWQKLENYYPGTYEGYSDIRQKFNTILSYYLDQIWVTQKYIGGRSFNRDHPDDPNGRLPFESISLEEQRQALNILDQYLFAKDAFSFSSSLLNRLAPSRWSHWGQEPAFWNLDYPVYDMISFFQRDLLWWLLSDYRLNQLQDLQTKTSAGEAFTLSEFLSTLETTVWDEIFNPDPDQVNLIGLRRSLQREHLNILTQMVLRETNPPEDARSIAWYQLRELKDKINDFLGKYGNQLDLDTKAHLEESSDRINKTLSAQIQSR
jgi:hypothetical protein